MATSATECRNRPAGSDGQCELYSAWPLQVQPRAAPSAREVRRPSAHDHLPGFLLPLLEDPLSRLRPDLPAADCSGLHRAVAQVGLMAPAASKYGRLSSSTPRQCSH